nr:Chain C, Programmed cell death 6-interacting protein [synthetic construct]
QAQGPPYPTYPGY